MAKAASEVYKQQPSVPVLIRFCGTSPGSCNARSLVLSLCAQIEFIFELAEKKSQAMVNHLYKDLIKYFHSLLQQHPVILFIDSLDQLSDDDLGRSDISFLRDVKPHKDTRIIVSCLPDEAVADPVTGRRYLYLCDTRLKEGNVPRVTVEMSEESGLDEAMNILMQSLQQKSRTLTVAQQSVVRSRIAEEQQRTALYIHLAVGVIANWTSETDASSGLAAGGVKQLILQLYETLQRDFGKELFRAALGFLTYSVKGVTDVEMEDLLSLDDAVLDAVFQYHKKPGVRRLPTHVWLRLRMAMESLIVEGEQGCLQLYHRQLKETAEEWIVEEKIRSHSIMAMYFGNLIDSTTQQKRKIDAQEWTMDGCGSFRKDSIVNTRRCCEASHHMLQCGMNAEAEQELCNFEGICSKVRAGEGFELVLQLSLLRNRMTVEAASSDERCTRVTHYLRWLKQCIHDLMPDFSSLFTFSASHQPFASVVRREVYDFLKIAKAATTETDIQKYQFTRGRILGGATDFDSLITVFKGHMNNVMCVEFSPDGKQLASGGEDKTMRLWDVESGQCTSTLRGHSGQVNSVCFSPDGKQLASGSMDGTVRSWDVELGQCTSTLRCDVRSLLVYSVCFSPDGKLLASGSSDWKARLWDIETGHCIATFQEHRRAVSSVTFSIDGKQLASGSEDNTLCLWDVESRQCTSTLRGHSSRVSSVCYSPDGKQLVSGSWDVTVRVWDVESGECITILQDFPDVITSVRFRTDGKQLAVGFWDSTVQLWDLELCQCTSKLEGHHDRISSVCYSPDGKQLVSAAEDKMIHLWDVDSEQRTSTTQDHSNEVKSVCFSPDGKLVASGSNDKTWRLWDVEFGQCTFTLQGQLDKVDCVRFSPDGKHLATASESDSAVHLWDVQSGKCVSTFQGHSDDVNSVCFSSDGKLLASGSIDRTVRLWDVESGQCTATLQGHSTNVSTVCFTPDGKRLVSGSVDKTIRLWDTESGQCIYTLQEGLSYVNSVCVSPDGKQLASGSENSMLHLWDIESGQCVSTLQGHSRAVYSVCFSPDGKQLATASLDNSVRLWDVESRQCTSTLLIHSHKVHSVCFSPDGKQLATGGLDDMVRLVDMTS